MKVENYFFTVNLLFCQLMSMMEMITSKFPLFKVFVMKVSNFVQEKSLDLLGPLR